MNKVFSIFCGGIAFLGFCFVSSCSSGGYKPVNNTVTVHELSDAESLNPMNSSDAAAGYIGSNLFQPLISIDFKTLELIPVLATSRPQIEKTENGNGLIITYQVRPEATWDNGSPITAADVEFSMKVIKNPKVNNPHSKSYYEFISDVKLYPDDPKKITFICNEVYIRSESGSGSFAVLPEYFYDPTGLMKNFSIKQLNEEGQKLVDDKNINAFATEFNSEKKAREKDQIVGSGPYKLAEWTTGQRIVIERKKEWWGDKLTNENCYFEAYPEKIIYQTVNDQTSALVSLKAGNLDVMYSIKPKDFTELPQSEKFTQSFNTYTPTMLAYYFFGLNMAKEKFADKKVRKAIAHLCDIDKMIKTSMYDLAQKIVGPVHPSNKKCYNDTITPYEFNIDKAKQLLEDAGWKDTDGNGIIDKMINGTKTEFSITVLTNSGNDMRKQMALIFQEAARKVGIEVTVAQLDGPVFINNLKKHDFDICISGWVAPPLAQDFKQTFHTESILNEGSNYVSFGNTKSDALIDSIRAELDEEKRAELYKQFQVILHEEVPYVFICSPTERIAINKRFSNVNESTLRPGFWEAGFKTTE